MAAFDFLEAKLKDLSFKIAFVRERNKKLGGMDLKDAVITAWHFVISIYLRAKFNWLGNPRAGKETKRGLESTNVKKAVFGVIEQLSSYTNNYDVIKLTKNAIRHAPQTTKGRAN
ncbi:hypothetical protein DAPPUDRAFT_326565 [Daphnia pulex]|uniref:Uncharacterized protein n=1 Tax=Daphnia pulex TaxID=6669 RepID=E9H846_DAPPU|nr:hypothetical protein DAPPUDRAFT_326565 [Daphnia pulex]|eukprot:EFX72008.1 hypothetical protein DAPPUDRAFT_326565 [Daphnia pulex]